MINTKFLIAASLSLTLAGCGSMGANTSMYSVHQPVVARTNYAIDINTNGGGGITSSEEGRMAEWFDALRLGYGDRISVDYGDSYSNPVMQQSISRIASKYGMAVSETAPLTPGNITPGTARIIVTRSKASVPSCPDHSTTSDTNFNSSTSSNYGCAANSNLAVMVADPEDLVRGRQTNPINASGTNAAIKANRDKRQGATK